MLPPASYLLLPWPSYCIRRLVQHLDGGESTLISAHDNSIACIAMNQSGTRVATASTRGTLIRIFETTTGKKLQELRRGSDRAVIYSMW